MPSNFVVKDWATHKAEIEAWQKRMATRMSSDIFNLDKLVRSLLREHWMHECQIIPDYMPPFPDAGTKPRCVIFHPETDRYLRYSCGPGTGTFWDVYGDDFHSPELALVELSKAYYPKSIPTWD